MSFPMSFPMSFLCRSYALPMLFLCRSYVSPSIITRFPPKKAVPCGRPHGQQCCDVTGPAQSLPALVSCSASAVRARILQGAALSHRCVESCCSFLLIFLVEKRRGKARWKEETTLRPMTPTNPRGKQALRLQNPQASTPPPPPLPPFTSKKK